MINRTVCWLFVAALHYLCERGLDDSNCFRRLLYFTCFSASAIHLHLFLFMFCVRISCELRFFRVFLTHYASCPGLAWQPRTPSPCPLGQFIQLQGPPSTAASRQTDKWTDREGGSVEEREIERQIERQLARQMGREKRHEIEIA